MSEIEHKFIEHARAVSRLTRDLPECRCGHLKYTHRYLGGTLACTVLICRCTEYEEKRENP